MALENFLGTWRVQLASGTPFGVGGSIRIEKPGDPTGDPTEVLISFENVPGPPLRGFYDAAKETIEVRDPPNPTSAMYISRYVDKDQPYRAIYGLMVGEGCDPIVAVWGADLQSASGSVASAGPFAPPPALSLYDGRYTVQSAAGSAYGKGSRLLISDKGIRITVTDNAGKSVPSPESLIYDLPTVSLQGAIPQQKLLYQWSLATFNGKKYIYGLSVVGGADVWPEQAGACGAEEEDPDPGKYT